MAFVIKMKNFTKFNESEEKLILAKFSENDQKLIFSVPDPQNTNYSIG